MKKAFCINKGIKFILFCIAGCLFIFNTSCGLDTYEVFESPVQTIHKPEFPGDFVENYFEFYTNEPNTSYSTIKYLGTSVYYKIYNSLSVCESEAGKLEEMSSEDETSANAAERMINTYGYKELKSSNSKDSVLIPTKTRDQIVKIRLTDYGSMDDFAAKILVDDNSLGAGTSKPLRYLDKETSFNFGRYNDEIATGRKVYADGDEDIRNSTSGDVEPGIWYVSMFAVGVARDMAFSPQYSNILYLGSVKINENSKDN